MKVFLLVMGVLLTCFTTVAQGLRHEFYVGAGILPLPHLRVGMSNMIQIGMLFGGRNTALSYSIPLQAGYTYYLNEKVQLGILANRYAYEWRYTDNNELEQRKQHLSLIPNIQYMWQRKNNIQVYSGLGIGISQETHLHEDKEKIRYKDVTHVTVLGLKVGRRSGMFLDFGLGYNGLANAGVFARL